MINLPYEQKNQQQENPLLSLRSDGLDQVDFSEARQRSKQNT